MLAHATSWTVNHGFLSSSPYLFSVFSEEMPYIREVYQIPYSFDATCGKPSSKLRMYRARAYLVVREKWGKRGEVTRRDEGKCRIGSNIHEGKRSRRTRSLDRSGRLFARLPRYHDGRFSKRQHAAGSFPSDERYHIIFYPQIPPYPDASP